MIVIAEPVRAALDEGRPVVALESTIITHGMPYPQNKETALSVEAAVRSAGATPATIAVIDGRPHVGIDNTTIDRLARGGATKASRRDLAALAVERRDAGTTVAATMILAKRAGIRVFATGGIGGVHRGYESTLDVSADLDELGRNRTAVVCAGIKAILDLPRTVEYLETRGVPIIGYRCDSLPAFYARSSDLEIDYRFDTADDIASLLKAQDVLELDSGELIVNPLPESLAMPRSAMQALIEEALAAMREAGVSGKACTPFLLAHIANASGGDSLDTNIELIHRNATLAAEIAGCYAVQA